MNLLKHISALVEKEVRLEWRKPLSLNGVLLYVGSTVFVAYMSFQEVEARTWNTLFWIIMLFASINAVGKSFLQDSPGRYLYQYTIYNPLAVILAKTIYNFLLLLVLAFLQWGLFSILLGNPVIQPGIFALCLVLGSLSFAASFTLISAIASRAGNNGTLMPILSFPLIIPIVALLIQTSVGTLLSSQDAALINKVSSILGINTIALALSFLLFPYLWRD